METISTAIHGQCWVSDGICSSCGAVGLLCKGIQPLKWWQRSGMDDFKKLWDSIRSMKYVGWLAGAMLGKKQRVVEGGVVQHLNSQSDWLWWQCDGRGHNGYQGLLCVFTGFHSLGSVTGGPSFLFSRFVQMKQRNQRNVSMSLLCLSAQSRNMYFLWLTSCRHFKPFLLLDLNRSLLHSVLFYFDVSAENCKA